MPVDIPKKSPAAATPPRGAGAHDRERYSVRVHTSSAPHPPPYVNILKCGEAGLDWTGD